MHRPFHLAVALFAALAAIAAFAPRAFSANGTWAAPVSGDYITTGNWTGGTVASGAGFTADFNSVDLNGDVAVTLDAPQTIGNIVFGDTDTNTGGVWTLQTTNTSVLTLNNSGPSPTITVNQLTPVGFDDVFIGNPLAGTAGFTKAGPGILTLGPGVTNTITGGINVSAGTLRLQAAIPGQVITIGNGATLQTAVTLDAGTPAPGHRINVASGATATINTTASIELGNFGAPGATLNINLSTAGTTLTADGDWAIGGSAAAVNFSSTAGGFIRLRPNSGSPAFNTVTAFQNSAVNLDNVTMWTRSNSGGNDVNMGSLSGTATAVLGGGGQGGGTAARYFIGSLNTNTEFAGTINSAATGVPTPIGGINIIKVGTGTLTLSGTITNPPQVTGTGASTNAAVRGGVTQIQNGTLALTNSATITGGINDPGAGVVLTTIDVQAAGTLNVTGYTAGTYQTQPMQQIVGSGNIVGNWDHAAGFIRAANTVPAFSANTTAVGGTINFNNNLALSGGDIVHDATLNPAVGNDLINVGGSVTISGGKIVPNFLNGLPPTTNVYTVLTAAGGITGSPASMIVDFPGRSPDGVPSIVGNSLVYSPTSGGAAKNLVWRGNSGPNWDEEVTTNWVDGVTPEKFFQFDNATFNDTAVSPAVTVVGVVRPGSITIGGANNFAFTGTGSISGPAGLTKTGAGNLTMQLGNSFTGPSSVQGGTLDIAGSNAALGLGPLTLDGVNVNANVGFSNSSLAVANNVTINIAGAAAAGGAYGVPNLSGSGTVTFNATVADKFMTLSGNAFTGTVNFGMVGQTGTLSNVRLNNGAGGSNWAGSVINLNGPVVVSDRQSLAANVVANFQFGELHASDAGATLNAFLGGSPATDANWIIGALNTNSDFAGNIIDGAGNNATVSESHLTKVGTGELVISGFVNPPIAANPYFTGDTAVFGGTLRTTVAAGIFSNEAGNKVRVNTGGILNLDYAGQDDIFALILNGVSVAPGEWGGPSSGAPNTSPLLAGTGTLLVTGKAIPGDFDLSGTVNAADLAVWQTSFAVNRLGDADGDFDTDGNDFLIWQRNLGMVASVAASSPVPEPTSALLALACLLAIRAVGPRRSKTSL